jgi:hypothetical protein
MYKSAATGTTANPWYGSAASQPGGSTGFASHKIRVLAACLQVFYPGAESSRQGIWGVGLVPTNTLNFGASTTPANAMSTLTNLRRVDEKMLEVKWVPGSEDTDWFFGGRTSVTNNDVAPECNSMMVAWSGLPANQTLQIRMTMVVERMGYDVNVVDRTLAYTPPPVNTLSQVLNWLHSKEPTWFLNVTDAAWSLGSTALSVF